MSTPSAAILSRVIRLQPYGSGGAERNRSGPFVCGSAPGEAAALQDAEPSSQRRRTASASPILVGEPTAPRARALLDQYIAAFENADAAALERLLARDAVIEATPLRTWFAGRKTCMPFLRSRLLGSAGHWRMLATSANGQPAAAAYTRDSGGNYQPYGICVLTVTSGHPPDLLRRRPETGHRVRLLSDSFPVLTGSPWV